MYSSILRFPEFVLKLYEMKQSLTMSSSIKDTPVYVAIFLCSADCYASMGRSIQ